MTDILLRRGNLDRELTRHTKGKTTWRCREKTAITRNTSFPHSPHKELAQHLNLRILTSRTVRNLSVVFCYGSLSKPSQYLSKFFKSFHSSLLQHVINLFCLFFHPLTKLSMYLALNLHHPNNHWHICWLNT